MSPLTIVEIYNLDIGFLKEYIYLKKSVILIQLHQDSVSWIDSLLPKIQTENWNILMNSLLTDNIDNIKNLCRMYDVEKLYAFGSVMTDTFSDSSDIDLLIKFKKIPFERYADNYFELHEILEKFFNRKVDLITENSLSNLYFIKKLNETKTVLYEG